VAFFDSLLHFHAQLGGGAELAVVLLQHRFMSITLIVLGVPGVLGGFRPTPWLKVRNVSILVLAGLLPVFTSLGRTWSTRLPGGNTGGRRGVKRRIPSD